jgi:hypothetical protein
VTSRKRNPRRRLLACESGDKLHVALAHAAAIGSLQAPLPEGLQLAFVQHRTAITCATQSCFVSSCLACDGLGVVSCALQLQTELYFRTLQYFHVFGGAQP